MTIAYTIKQFSLALGLYRPTLWLSRKLQPRRQRAFQDDVALYAGLLPPRALCFDIGANIGLKSEAFLKAGAASVVAFEPNPRVVPELRARCGRAKNWTLIQAALGSGAGVATLHARKLHGQSSLLTDATQSETLETFHVPVITLDAAIAQFGRPAYCKIDVEGFELQVLSGLSHALPLVSFEFHLDARDVPNTTACLRRLAEFGPCHVNVLVAGTAALHLKEWMPPEKFLEWYPAGLRQDLQRWAFGDIFVRNKAV